MVDFNRIRPTGVAEAMARCVDIMLKQQEEQIKAGCFHCGASIVSYEHHAPKPAEGAHGVQLHAESMTYFYCGDCLKKLYPQIWEWFNPSIDYQI